MRSNTRVGQYEVDVLPNTYYIAQQASPRAWTRHGLGFGTQGSRYTPVQPRGRHAVPKDNFITFGRSCCLARGEMDAVEEGGEGGPVRLGCRSVPFHLLFFFNYPRLATIL